MTITSISYSRLRTLDCWRKHHLQYNVGLKPLHRFAALDFGSAWDAAQDVYWNKDLDRYSPDVDILFPSIEAGKQALNQSAADARLLLAERGLSIPESFDDDLNQMQNMLHVMMFNYFEHWHSVNHRYEVLANQLRLEVALPSRSGSRSSNRYKFVGIVDRIVRDKSTDRVLIVDAKTCKDLTDDYRAGYDNDLQLPLYVWAARKAGWQIDGVMIDAAAKRVPYAPNLRANPLPVFDDAGNEIFDPVLDAEGNPVVFKTGKRAGEAKTVRRTRPALQSMFNKNGGVNYFTTLRMFKDAISANSLNDADYKDELRLLTNQHTHAVFSPFFWREEIHYTNAQISQAVNSLRDVAGMMSRLPDVPMPDRFKCKNCSYKRLCGASPEQFNDLAQLHFTTPNERKVIGND
jgi:RecB family exonuclease